MLNAHAFRQKLTEGRPLLAAAVTLADPVVAELLSRSVDLLWIDAEHGPLGSHQVQAHLIAASVNRCPVVVRVPTGDVGYVKHVLDAGADGVVAPQVRTVDEARRMVAACRYPPLGSSGYGPRRAGDYRAGADRGYPARANAEVLAFVMLEDAGALRDLDDILAIPGLDGVVIGPADLSASLGHIGELEHPAVQAAIDDIVARTRARGKILGVGGGDDVAAARAWFARGVQWMQAGGDVGYIAAHFDRIAAAIRAP